MAIVQRGQRLQHWTAAVPAVALCALAGAAEPAGPAVVDDPSLDAIIASVRAEFLRGKPFDRLDVTLLIRQADGTWRRGSFRPEALAYPASCVKLAYLAAAMHWCRSHGRPYESLDHCVGPMVRSSDNVQTGVVVDAITGTTNLADLSDATDPRFGPWLEARGYTERFLDGLGLLAGQTIVHKTYPTNSGDMPVGAEKVARAVRGMNRMSPRASADLMLRIVAGGIEPAAREYMSRLLEHDPRSSASVLGFGMPPGTRYLNKPGLAYDTLEDIAYAVLPNGRELIVAAFSNAFCKPYSQDPAPHDSSQLGPFMEALLAAAGLTTGNPPVVAVDVRSPGFSSVGEWHRDGAGADTALRAPSVAGPKASWRLDLPSAGRYEIRVRYPQDAQHAPDACYTVHHAQGQTAVSVDQTRAGGRWYQLGDFEFRQGEGLVELTAATAPAPERRLVADAVQAARYPDAEVALPALRDPL